VLAFCYFENACEIRLALTNVEAKRNDKMEEEMHKGKWIFKLILTVVLGLGWSLAWAQFPNNPTWTTVLKGKGPIEGLTGDNNGNFYVADRVANTCNVWKIDTNTVPATVSQVGAVNQPGCSPAGITFGPDGALYVTSPSQIYRLFPGDSMATLYADGVPGANGVAFLGNDLFVTDGTANRGRVWKITGSGAHCASAPPVACEEFLRIQARRNGDNLGGNVLPADQPDGVGSVRYTAPNHNTQDPSGADKQDITANGIAFSADGMTMFVTDTARGAIWAAQLKGNGDLKSATGCDPTFHPNTLCMESLYVAHPLLEGIDGIILLVDGTILASVNERNAIVAVASDKSVVDAFQNPADPFTYLRNGDPAAGRPLEFPTSPFASFKTFCTTGADSSRRDNNPNLPGDGPKVICLDHNLSGSGLPLPVQ
jgi:hypothetical protein